MEHSIVATMGVGLLQLNANLLFFLGTKSVRIVATMEVIMAMMELLYLSTFCSLFGCFLILVIIFVVALFLQAFALYVIGLQSPKLLLN
jgi:hypothetical protein